MCQTLTLTLTLRGEGTSLGKFPKKKSLPYCFKWLQKVEEANLENEAEKEAKASSVLFSLNDCLKNCFKFIT